MRRIFWIIFLMVAVAAAALTAKVALDRKTAEVAVAAPDYTMIEPGLYMGGRGGKPAEARAVLNLSPQKDDYTAEIYVWHPIQDAPPAPTLAWLAEQVAFIDAQRRAGVPVFVHCDAGISRSGMVLTAYYIKHNQWTQEEALAFIRVRRPQVHPNAAFMELLQAWESQIIAPAMTMRSVPATAADHTH